MPDVDTPILMDRKNSGACKLPDDEMVIIYPLEMLKVDESCCVTPF